MSPHHRLVAPEGKWERRLWTFERIWQDVMPLLLVLAFLYVAGLLNGKVDETELQAERTRAALVEQKREAERQRQGRQVAIDVLCGGVYGVEIAGRAVLTNNLPGLDYPPETKAEKQFRRQLAVAYNEIISQSVIEQAGVDVNGILNRNGTVDCDELIRAAKARPEDGGP